MSHWWHRSSVVKNGLLHEMSFQSLSEQMRLLDLNLFYILKVTWHIIVHFQCNNEKYKLYAIDIHWKQWTNETGPPTGTNLGNPVEYAFSNTICIYLEYSMECTKYEKMTMLYSTSQFTNLIDLKIHSTIASRIFSIERICKIKN